MTQAIKPGVALLATACAVTCFAARTPFWERVIRFMGISQSPTLSRGGGQAPVVAGEIRMATLADGHIKLLAADRLYRSPIFDREDKSVLALSGDDLFRISVSEGAPVSKLQTIPDVHKLVGFQQTDGDQILVLTCSQKVGLLSLSNFAFEPITYDENSPDDQTMLRHIRDWDRSYDKDLRLEVDQVDGSGPWQVFLKRNLTEPLNVSKCRKMHCGQPSMSQDRRQVVFIGQPWK